MLGATSSPLQWGGLEELEPGLRAYLGRRCRDGSEVDDVVQETLLRAARYRDSIVDLRRLQGWVTRIARNVLSDHIRRECRLRRAEAAEERLPGLVAREVPPGETGELASLYVGRKLVDTEDLLGHLEAAMGDLRDEDRRALHAYYGGGQDCRGTGAELGIPAALVKVRLFRARRRLARAIRRSVARGGAPEASGGAA